MSNVDNTLNRGYRTDFPSPMVMFGILLMVSLAFCVLVYVIPAISGQSIDGAYDAFAYAANMSENPIFARELQPFLNIYPSWSGTVLFFYALLLHMILAMPALISLRALLGRGGVTIVLAAMMIPESTMFLGSISKEGLGIVAVIVALAGQTLVIRRRVGRGVLMCAYSILIAEVSRPFYGIPFGAALIIGFLPAIRPSTRLRIYFLLLVGLIIGLWAILLGPFASEFTEKYLAAKQFLDWFEEEMGSDSPVKATIRQFFALAFGSNEPSLILILLISFAAIAKALVYVLAIPLVAPANFSNMPAQTWALTWQVAATVSSIAMATGLARVRKINLGKESKCRLLFGVMLMLAISVSTAIFHVRYRVPAVVVILAAIWLVLPPPRWVVMWMTLLTLCASAIALVMTS